MGSPSCNGSRTGQFSQAFLNSYLRIFLNNKQDSGRLYFRLFLCWRSEHQGHNRQIPELCRWHLIKPNGKQCGHRRMWRSLSRNEKRWMDDKQAPWSRTIRLDSTAFPISRHVAEFNYDIMQFVFFLPFHPRWANERVREGRRGE